RVIIGVDDVVCRPGVLRLRGEHFLCDGTRLPLPREGRIGRRSSCGSLQGQGIEQRCLAVFGVTREQLLHGLLVGEHTRAVIHLVKIPVESSDGCHVRAFPLCLRADGFRPLQRRDTCLQVIRIGWRPQRAPAAHRYAPVGDRAGVIFGRYCGELLLRRLIPERIRRSLVTTTRSRRGAWWACTGSPFTTCTGSLSGLRKLPRL